MIVQITNGKTKFVDGICFDAPPPADTVIVMGKEIYHYITAEPYRRKSDGKDSFILHWRRSPSRSLWTSGLRGNSFRRLKL